MWRPLRHVVFKAGDTHLQRRIVAHEGGVEGIAVNDGFAVVSKKSADIFIHSARPQNVLHIFQERRPRLSHETGKHDVAHARRLGTTLVEWQAKGAGSLLHRCEHGRNHAYPKRPGQLLVSLGQGGPHLQGNDSRHEAIHNHDDFPVRRGSVADNPQCMPNALQRTGHLTHPVLSEKGAEVPVFRIGVPGRSRQLIDV